MIRWNHKSAVIVLASAAILVAVALLAMMKPGLRASDSASPQRSLWVGDILPLLPNYSWAAHKHSLILAARVDCSHCKASVPFYRRLELAVAAGSGDRVGVVAVFPNPQNQVQAFLHQADLNVPAISSTPLGKLSVTGTPTLILADSKGTVLRVWVGELNADEQSELLVMLRLYIDGKET